MILRIFVAIFLIISSFCSAKPPQLTSHDARLKIEEVLKAHVSYQKLTPELIQRALENYLEELDPGKTYLIESDIDRWIQASPELLLKTLQNYKQEDFSVFEEMHETVLKAIEKRNLLEEKIGVNGLPKNVQPSEFKDIKWATSEEELLDRLQRIKALQLDAAEKLNQETRDQFIQRLAKRRLKKEEELIAANPAERKQVVLSYVLKAISSSLDSQTAYFTPAEANQFMIQVQQRLFGIGAQLRDDLNGFTIVRLLEGGPASMENKLKSGDRIIAVNNEPVVGLEITEAVELIRGPQGSAVLLTILRETGDETSKKDEKLDIEIIRDEIVLKESRYEINYEPYGDGVIAILQLFSFYQDSHSSSATDLLEALETIKKEHRVRGVILDLRNNGGGFLPQAVAVTGLFIKKGIVVSVKDNTGSVQHLRNIEGKVTWSGPLIALTSRISASASEIVAQTLQDYGRALVVGDPETYGKGTFQSFTLEASNYGKVNPKGEVKITRGRYYTVSGKSPQLVGVKADIVVPGFFSEMELGEKFSKFPLETDQIKANFEDDLSDVPFIHRGQIQRLYKFDMQPILNTYQPYVAILRKNSQERIQLNQNYQNFLKELAKKDLASEATDLYGQTDLQQEEAINIMKDLIYLMEQNDIQAKAFFVESEEATKAA